MGVRGLLCVAVTAVWLCLCKPADAMSNYTILSTYKPDFDPSIQSINAKIRARGPIKDDRPTNVFTPHWLPVDELWPEYSDHFCAGTDGVSRSCRFDNLVYDTQERQFLYYPKPDPVDGYPNANQTIGAVMRIRQLITMKYRSDFRLVVVNGPFPTRAESCDEVEPLYLTSVYRLHSFGYLVRDMFHVITANVHELTVPHITYKLAVLDSIVNPSPSSTDITAGMRLLRKYAQWVGEGAFWFREITDTCTPSKRYILFRNFVAGSLVFEMHNKPSFAMMPARWGGCNSTYFEQHRDIAYKIGRVPLVEAFEQTRIKVLFDEKRTNDVRRMLNINSTKHILQARFPTLDFETSLLSIMSPRAQLEELSTTTIFVTPHASSSYRMVYLPTGAHTIVIGPPEFGGHTEAEAFADVNACWGNIKHVKMHKYHVTTEAEVVFREFVSRNPQDSFLRWFDSDVILDAVKLGDIIDDAIRGVRADAAECCCDGEEMKGCPVCRGVRKEICKREAAESQLFR